MKPKFIIVFVVSSVLLSGCAGFLESIFYSQRVKQAVAMSQPQPQTETLCLKYTQAVAEAKAFCQEHSTGTTANCVPRRLVAKGFTQYKLDYCK